MKIVIIFVCVIAVLIVALLAVLGAHGVFSKVKVSEESVGPYSIVYARHQGPYEKIGAVMNKVAEGMRGQGVTPLAAIGIYYDNPAKTDKNALRSLGGYCVARNDLAKIKDGLLIAEIPASVAVVARMPLRSPLSYMLLPAKVYPALERYIKEKGYNYGPSVEVYDERNKSILYISPVKLDPVILEKLK